MVTQQLLEYIRQETAQGISREVIIQNLKAQGGWSDEQITAALEMAEKGHSAVPVSPVQAVPAGPAYAGFWIRFVARFIDRLILGFATMIVFFILAALSGGVDNAAPFFVPFYILVAILYSIMMIHSYQATVGKMSVGIKVTAADGSRLSLGKIILRELVGKPVSYITLSIGFLIAAFTERKQGLHDFIAGSVVQYKEPAKKSNVGLIVGICIVGFFVVIAVIGILSSVVLASLTTARAKGNDAAIKAALAGSMAEAFSFSSANGSLAGYDATAVLPECSGGIVQNASPDGKGIAFLAKSCSDSKSYFCLSDRTDSTSKANQVVTLTDVRDPSKVLDCSQQPSAFSLQP